MIRFTHKAEKIYRYCVVYFLCYCALFFMLYLSAMSLIKGIEAESFSLGGREGFLILISPSVVTLYIIIHGKVRSKINTTKMVKPIIEALLFSTPSILLAIDIGGDFVKLRIYLSSIASVCRYIVLLYVIFVPIIYFTSWVLKPTFRTVRKWAE